MEEKPRELENGEPVASKLPRLEPDLEPVLEPDREPEAEPAPLML